MDTSIDLYAEISKADAEKKATISKVNGVVALLDEMNEEDRTSLLKALHDHSIDGTVIFNVLQKNGWNISKEKKSFPPVNAFLINQLSCKQNCF